MQLPIYDLLSGEDSRNVVNRLWIVYFDRIRVNLLHGVNLVCLLFMLFTHVRVYEFLFSNRVLLFNDVVEVIMTNYKTFIFEFLYLGQGS